jgi:myosin protein heavy chain
VQDLEALQRQVEELQAANDKLDKSKKKLQAELEDTNIDLEAQRAKVLELEKKQRNFDKVLAEEKVSRTVTQVHGMSCFELCIFCLKM